MRLYLYGKLFFADVCYAILRFTKIYTSWKDALYSVTRCTILLQLHFNGLFAFIKRNIYHINNCPCYSVMIKSSIMKTMF